MSETKAYQCDGSGCKNRCDDYMSSGWIEFTGSLSGYIGRDKTGSAVSSVYYGLGETRHFCSWDCMKRTNQKGAKERMRSGA